jgi:SAM-dependent methyltransferase
VRRVGSSSVAAVDPSEPFVAAARARFPEVDVRIGSAEALPFDTDSFDAACAQLVVHFMEDPVAGLAEMARVTRPGGVVAACVWDFAGGRAPISAFWHAALELRADVHDESSLAGSNRGDLTRLLGAAALADVEEREISVEVSHGTFEEWWEPFTLGVGPVGSYMDTIDEPGRAALHDRCRELLGDGPIRMTATAWAGRGRS